MENQTDGRVNKMPPPQQKHRHHHVTRYKAYDPRNFSVKTVLWFTRDEIQTLKAFSSCNFLLFFLSTLILTIIGILAATGSYPFTIPAGILVHKTFAGLLVFQTVISPIGYFGIQAENSCIIDVYIASSGILIVSYILVLALFSNFAEPDVIKFFRSTLLFQAFTSLFIIINCVLIWSAFVVEMQIRTYGSVGAIQPLSPEHPPASSTELIDGAEYVSTDAENASTGRQVAVNGHIEQQTVRHARVPDADEV